MGCIGRLLLAVLLISASACSVQGKLQLHWGEFYNKRPSNLYTQVFRPLADQPVINKGRGWVIHSDLISRNELVTLGHAGELYFFHSTDAVEVIQTFTFSENLEGIWKGSSLSMRGLWRRKPPNWEVDSPEQELAIVGGQGGLKNASSGTVKFHRLQMEPFVLYMVECRVYVEDYKDLKPAIKVDFDSMYKAGTELVHDSPETTDDVLKQVGGSP